MTRLTFYNGLRTIGGTHILVQHGDSALLFDLGLKYDPAGLFGSHAPLPPALEPSIYTRTRFAPPIRGLLQNVTDEDLQVAAEGEAWPLAGPFAHFGVFLSHVHNDHVGLVPFLNPTDVYLSGPSLAILEALDESATLSQPKARFQALADYETFQVGSLRATLLPTDHDIVGASGLLIETPDGAVAYTGDWRRHGAHPERVDAFIAFCQSHKVDVLLTEGTRFRPDDAPTTPPIPEARLPELVGDALKDVGQRVLVNFYARNVERVAAFAGVAKAHGRTLAVHPETATLLEKTRALHGLEAHEVKPLETPDDWLEVITHAGDYLVEARTEDLPQFLLGPAISGGVYLHCDGNPLSEHDPSHPTMRTWLEVLGLAYHPLRSGGHAAPNEVHELIRAINPGVLVPIHSRFPERMLTRGVRFFVPHRGETVPLPALKGQAVLT